VTDKSVSRTKIFAAYAAFYLIWGSTYLGIRFAIETMPPFLMGGVRFLIAGTVLYVIMRSHSVARPTLSEWRSTAIVGAGLILGGNGMVVWAEQFVPSGLTALLVAILPFWMAIIDWIRPGGRPPTVGVSIGLVVGIIGLVILIGPSALHPSAASQADARGGNGVVLAGALGLMFGSLCWASGSIYAQHARMPRSAFLSTGMQMICGGLLMIFASVLRGEPMQFDLAEVSARSWIAFVYLVSIGSLIGYTAYIWLLTVQPPSRVATYAYVNPVVAVFLGWAMAGEALTLRTAIASAIIILAVVLITTARSSLLRQPAPEPA
jgi:drug/metabolite transporter (DMT)-like permease